jgi:CelD/BcsL family acetyltransferase involved in cellulose biosynthesis
LTTHGELDITIRRVDDFTSLGRVWRDLECRADGSFFQSWAWTGCLAEERFSDPRVLTATRGAQIVAIALFNRRPPPMLRLRPRLFLGESGRSELDSIFIEHNDLLVDRSESTSLASQCWAKLAAGEFGRARWVLSGTPSRLLELLHPLRQVRTAARRPAPYLDFTVAIGGGPVLDGLSANTRQQLRRSLREWERIGPLRLEIAASSGASEAFLDALKHLHQRYWTGRGKPGAFAEPFFERFLRVLIGRADREQAVDLIRVSAGPHILGYLLNFVHQGWVAAYQSGVDYSLDPQRLRPGLVCHLLAIEHYRRAGMKLYDFLGGEARYKRSFSNADRDLLWLEALPRSFWG